MRTAIVLLSISACLISCLYSRLPYDSKGLTYKGKFTFTGQIKMDGYFYRETQTGIRGEYFFEDGYYSTGGTLNMQNLLCDTIDQNVRKIPYSWGCFIIENDTLKLQYFPGYGRDKYGKFMTGERWAKIEDQGMTLRYFKKKDIDGNVIQIDEVYKFHQCSNKPNSLNVLMDKN
jgi:hypothetical protein